MLEQPLVFADCSSIQFLNSPLPQTQSIGSHLVVFSSLRSACVTYEGPCHSIGHQVLPTPTLAEGSRCFFQGLETSLECASAHILSLFLISHQKDLILHHQKELLDRFWLCVRDCYGTLYQPLTDFEPTLLFITLYVARRLFYPLGHTEVSYSVFCNYIYLIINTTQTIKNLVQSAVTQIKFNFNKP